MGEREVQMMVLGLLAIGREHEAQDAAAAAGRAVSDHESMLRALPQLIRSVLVMGYAQGVSDAFAVATGERGAAEAIERHDAHLDQSMRELGIELLANDFAKELDAYGAGAE